MNELLNKYNDYQKLVGSKLSYNLSNWQLIEVEFRNDNFLHLLGIHKLLDIGIVQQWLDKSNYKVKNKDVIRLIKSERFNDLMIRSSIFFNSIQDRYNSFSYQSLTTLSYTDAIINFNPTLVNSKLLSDYILFEKDKNNEYNHMAIAFDSIANQRYLESFFHETSDSYISGQVVVKINNYKLYDKDGNIIFEDTF